MINVSHIHVRPLELADFKFVQDLASRQSNFTVPAGYILWLLLRLKGAICLIAEKTDEGLLGYLLAVSMEAPNESLFVWQMATSHDPKRKISLGLLTALRDLARAQHVRTISFSARPRSAAYRIISQYTQRLVTTIPRFASALPPSVAENENEYRVDLG